MNGKKEFGDYQTPELFARKVCDLLLKKYAISPQIVIEPTCGAGNFLQESLIFDAKLYYGIEINESYCNYCRKKFDNLSNIIIYDANIFSFDLHDIMPFDEEFLIVGNPPWITNSELSKNSSTNIPKKTNIKSLNGFSAITGASNFDICEYIILNLIESVNTKKAVIAMLCKTSVARNIFAEINRRNISYSSFSLYNFDAKKVFNISASACLLVVDFRNRCDKHLPCIEFNIDFPFKENQILDYSNDGLTVPRCVNAFWGKCCFKWRQGVKHDCTKIMELKKEGQYFVNGLGEKVEIEQNYIFPLVKSSMFKSPVINTFQKYVIITQTKIKEDTNIISRLAPKTWEYLMQHKEQFDNRKSSIYKNAPAFSMFGIGDYSFAKYKVAISGFYKVPLFSLLYSSDNKAVMCDDTSYFIAFSNYNDAYLAMLLLNSNKVRKFLQAASFQDAKRPFTKQLLNKIDFKSILEQICIDDLIQIEKKYNLPFHVTEKLFESFQKSVNLLSGF